MRGEENGKKNGRKIGLKYVALESIEGKSEREKERAI